MIGTTETTGGTVILPPAPTSSKYPSSSERTGMETAPSSTSVPVPIHNDEYKRMVSMMRGGSEFLASGSGRFNKDDKKDKENHSENHKNKDDMDEVVIVNQTTELPGGNDEKEENDIEMGGGNSQYYHDEVVLLNGDKKSEQNIHRDGNYEVEDYDVEVTERSGMTTKSVRFAGESPPASHIDVIRRMGSGDGSIIDPPPGLMMEHTNSSSFDDFSEQSYGSKITPQTPILERKKQDQKKLSFSDRWFENVFGSRYSKRECSFVIIAGALLAFNSGYVNGSCVAGLLTPTGKGQNVAGFTVNYTESARSLAAGDWPNFGYQTTLILSYMCGTFISGLITPRATPYQIEPSYGPTFMIGGILLLGASILAALEASPRYIFFFATAANGVQNGIASIYSANLIRCSLTGATTDLALCAAQALRGNFDNMWRGLVLLSIVCNFWLGGLISFWATQKFLTFSLFVNAGLFWLIGIALVCFLVNELDISVKAAVLGNWRWRDAMESLRVSMDCDDNQSRLLDMFDQIDTDKNGQIEHDELLSALQTANVNISSKGVKILIKWADEDNDGLINRDEWEKIVHRLLRKADSLSASERWRL